MMNGMPVEQKIKVINYVDATKFNKMGIDHLENKVKHDDIKLSRILLMDNSEKFIEDIRLM